MTVQTYCVDCVQRGRGNNTARKPLAHHSLYDTPQWRAYSKQYRAENPHCADPYHRHPGEPRPTAQVDHVEPHKGDLRLFWSPRNHQPLCASCGGYKSAVEEGGRASGKQPLAPISGVHGVKWAPASGGMQRGGAASMHTASADSQTESTRAQDGADEGT